MRAEASTYQDLLVTNSGETRVDLMMEEMKKRQHELLQLQ